MILVVMIFTTAINVWGSDVITGHVVSDRDGKGVGNVIVRLYVGTTLKSYAKSKSDGSFVIKDFPNDSVRILRFMSPNFETKEVEVRENSEKVNVVMIPKNFVLPEFVARVPRTRVKGDTITYDVASYTNATDRSIEDVIKKLPGVEVLENGKILYDGYAINHFYIEGLDLMGGSYSVASRNIKPEDIVTISVYERHQPKRVLQGVVSSKNAALNLKLKKNKLLKPVGYISGGVGAGSGTLWRGDLYAMEIAPSFQTILSVKGNNTGSPYMTPSNGNVAGGLFPQTPFGSPSIGVDRYWNNRSFTSSVNGLLKLKNEMHLKANVAYSSDNKDYEGGEEIEYLGVENPEASRFKEIVLNRLSTHSIGVGLEAERNIERLYFKDRLSFNGNFADNSYVISQKVQTNQGLKSEQYSIQNTLNAIWKIRGMIYDLKSSIRYNTVPDACMSYSDGFLSIPTVRQTLDAKTFHNSETVSVFRELGSKWQLGAEGGFSYNRESFLSQYLPATGSRESNDVTGHKTQVSFAPQLKFKASGRLVFTISLPVVLTQTSYRMERSANSKNMCRIRPDAEGTVFIKFNQRNTLDIIGGLKNTLGGIKDYIINPIQTTFRTSTVLGNGQLEKSTRRYVKMMYVKRTFEQPSNLKASVSYSRTERNTIAASQIGTEGVENSVFSQSSHSDMTTAMAGYTKNFLRANIVIGCDASGTWIAGKSIRDANIIRVLNSLYSLSGHVSTYQLNDRINADVLLNYSLSHQNYYGMTASTMLRDYSLRGKIEGRPFGSLIITGQITMNKSQLAPGQYKDNIFLDAGVRWVKKRWEAEVKATNLTNMRSYSYRVYRSLDITTYSYGLRPIEVCGILRVNF